MTPSTDLLLPDEDLALMRDAIAAGAAFDANIAQRDEWREVVTESERQFLRVHPENLSPNGWLQLRLAYLALSRAHLRALMQLHDAELDALQQRIARVRDRGLIEGETH